MISAFFKAFVQAADPKILKYPAGCALGAAAVFAALWAGAGYGLLMLAAHAPFPSGAALFAGAAGGAALTWMMFPAVFSAFACLFLDGAVAAAEARHHPGLPPARRRPFWASAAEALRFLALSACLNLAVLPVLLLPGAGLAFPALYYAVNGFLLGREYFDAVALRRLRPAEAREMRRRKRWPLLAAGAFAAFLLTVPLINLIAPVITAAAMAHLFHSWRGGANLAA